MPHKTCLNINFPKINSADCKGIKVCRQARGVWKEEFEHRQDPQGKDYYWLTGYFTNEEPTEDDTDEYLLQHNYAAIVPVKVDVTDYEDELNNYFSTANNFFVDPGIEITDEIYQIIPLNNYNDNLSHYPDPWFDQVDYRGAFGYYNWLKGWSLFGEVYLID